MKIWPETVVEAVARRRAILVLGAGASMQGIPQNGANLPPTWERFLKDATEQLQKGKRAECLRLIKAGEYLTACEIVKTEMSGEWPHFVQEKFGNQRINGGTLHEIVYHFDLPIIITTNFDKVYQSYAISVSSGTVQIKTYSDSDLALVARGSTKSRVILKAHGTIDDIGSMIFSRSDYVRLRSQYPLFQKVLEALSITHTFIFVGCGMRDPDFMLLLEDVAAISRGFGEHICLVDSRQSKELSRVYKDCYGVKAVTYDYDESHAQLAVVLGVLLDRSQEKRAHLKTAGLW